MKTYIGTKIVEAEPMVLGVYKETTGKDPYPGEDKPNYLPGYFVKYPDGYKSWSPAEVFEEAYSECETPLNKQDVESKELIREICELGDFIFGDNEDFKPLPVAARAILISQFYILSNHHNILCRYQSYLKHGKVFLKSNSEHFTFEQILPMLKEGFVLRRKAWIEGLAVFKQVPACINADIIPKMQSLPDQAKELILNTTKTIGYDAQCLIFNSQTGEANSWTPSVADIFAEDWEVVAE